MLDIDPTYEPQEAAKSHSKIVGIVFGLGMMFFGLGLGVGYLLGEADQIATIQKSVSDPFPGLIDRQEQVINTLARQTDALIEMARKGCMDPATQQ